VRNPLDVLVSFASLSNTMSHSGQPDYSYDKDYPVWWDWWVKDQAKSFAKYFDVLLKHCNKEGRNPIYITRYEDLVDQPEKELTDIFKFLLDMDDLTGTNAERRVKEIIAMGDKAA
jgi:hypothetical protein